MTLNLLLIRNFFSETEAVSNIASNLFYGIINGNRGALSRSVTLVESTNIYKREIGQNIISKCLKYAKENSDLQKTFRIGISGPPGAGKSTFIESFGTFLITKENKVAVLAVDPSSVTRGGSLLGDKVRMPRLSLNKNAYVRPSPTSGMLGGVARVTNEVLFLCEAAQYNIILVETVGVGQSETAVADMVDLFLLLIPPTAGDEMQGMKRGITELSDIIAVTKSDSDMLTQSKRIQAEYKSALRFLSQKSPNWKPTVIRISSMNHDGFDQLYSKIFEFRSKMIESGEFMENRQKQKQTWFIKSLQSSILGAVQDKFGERITSLQEKVAKDLLTPSQAVDRLLDEILTRKL